MKGEQAFAMPEVHDDRWMKGVDEGAILFGEFIQRPFADKIQFFTALLRDRIRVGLDPGQQPGIGVAYHNGAFHLAQELNSFMWLRSALDHIAVAYDLIKSFLFCVLKDRFKG